MARNVTMSVIGQGPQPGTYTVAFDQGNPFTAGGTPQPGQTTALAPPATAAMGYPVNMGGQIVRFATEADALKAQRYFEQHSGIPDSGVPAFGAAGGVSGGTGINWLHTGADALQTISAFLQGRNINNALDDMSTSLDKYDQARADLSKLSTLPPDQKEVFLRLFDAERSLTVAQARLAEDQLLAVDLEAGGSLAKVIADFMSGSRSFGRGGGGGGGGALLAAGAGLGLGALLLNRNTSNRQRF